MLLDILMPGMDGYEVCRRIRDQVGHGVPAGRDGDGQRREQKVKALEAGADDFVTKPVNQSELLARVASLARIKRYQDTIKRQAAELTAWNQELETRVESQVSQLQRMDRLRRFLSPQLAELIVDSGDESFLASHRREIVVVFCDLRGFTPFAEASEPEEVMGVLEEYHHALGDLIFRVRGHAGTLRGRRPDGVLQRSGAAATTARCGRVRMSVAMRDPGPRTGRDVVPARARPGARDRGRPGVRDARDDRVRRTARLRGDRERDQPGRAAVRRRRTLADPGHRAGLQRRRGRRSSARTPDSARSVVSAGPCMPTAFVVSTTPRIAS